MAFVVTPDHVAALQRTSPSPVEAFLPDSTEYDDRRQVRTGGFEHVKPAAVIVPKDAAQAASVVHWANSIGAKFTVRSGGNDFFARSTADGAVMIDMREMNTVTVSQDRKTATVGGGIIAKDLIIKLEEEGLITPTGNTWIVGYAGWASNGGYGPLTNAYGMGFEQIVAAEMVTAEGQVITANEELLEGIRGMVGNLGIITSLTIKVYPNHDIYSGILMYESTDLKKTISSFLEAEPSLPMPKELTTHHFIMNNPMGSGKIFAVFFTHPDPTEGQAVLQAWKDATPPMIACTVEAVSQRKQQQRMPVACGAKGGQRSLYLRRLPTTEGNDPVLAAVLEAIDSMPTDAGSNISWSGMITVDPKKAPANCFAPGSSHCFFSCSFLVFDAKNADEADMWCSGLIKQVRSTAKDALIDGGYPALNPTTERTAAQLYGDKWPRVKELKSKYDPNNLFGVLTS